MGQGFEIYWLGQTKTQLKEAWIDDSLRLAKVLIDLDYTPVCARLGLDALAITNPEPLDALPDLVPEMWAPPPEVAAAARRLIETLDAQDQDAEMLARDFCESWYTRSPFYRLREILSHSQFEGRRLWELRAFFTGRLRSDCRRNLIAALARLAEVADYASSQDVEHMTLDLGLEGYWAVDGKGSM